MSTGKGRKPTHNIIYRESGENRPWINIGSAWMNPRTKILTLRLGPLIDLSRMTEGSILCVAPLTEDRQRAEKPTKPTATKYDDFVDDELPF